MAKNKKKPEEQKELVTGFLDSDIVLPANYSHYSMVDELYGDKAQKPKPKLSSNKPKTKVENFLDSDIVLPANYSHFSMVDDGDKPAKPKPVLGAGRSTKKKKKTKVESFLDSEVSPSGMELSANVRHYGAPRKTLVEEIYGAGAGVSKWKPKPVVGKGPLARLMDGGWRGALAAVPGNCAPGDEPQPASVSCVFWVGEAQVANSSSEPALDEEQQLGWLRLLPDGELGGLGDGLVLHFAATPTDPGDDEAKHWALSLQFPRAIRFEPVAAKLRMPSESEAEIQLPGPTQGGPDVSISLNLVRPPPRLPSP